MSWDSETFISALFSWDYLKGAGLALGLAALAQAAASVLGLVLALFRGSKRGYLRALSAGYVWIFRAVPALLILIFIWNALPQLVPMLKQAWFSPFVAAFIGLAVLEAALMAEIFRSALSSIDAGQAAAGRALAMRPLQILRWVLAPQMIRVAIPPTGNQFINMIKLTSLASVISLQELLSTAQRDVSSTFMYAEYYAAAAVYYLVIVSIFMILQAKLEQRYDWRSSRTPKNLLNKPAASVRQDRLEYQT